ncbi:MAG: hypothetical protein ACFFAS_17210 [Promethearchaeota archaeon]
MASVIHLKSGITLFSNVYEHFCEQIEEGQELIGCFVQAIELFSKNIGQEGVREIEMSTVRVLIFEKNPILVAFIIDKDDNASLYRKKLDISLHTFLKNYGSHLSKKYNNASLFEGFEEDLKEILDLPNETILKACPECNNHGNSECLYVLLQGKLKPASNH